MAHTSDWPRNRVFLPILTTYRSQNRVCLCIYTKDKLKNRFYFSLHTTYTIKNRIYFSTHTTYRSINRPSFLLHTRATFQNTTPSPPLFRCMSWNLTNAAEHRRYISRNLMREPIRRWGAFQNLTSVADRRRLTHLYASKKAIRRGAHHQNAPCASRRPTKKPRTESINPWLCFSVPRPGVEPGWKWIHWCLRPARLPIPPSGPSWKTPQI